MIPPTRSLLGTHDILFITLDALRYDAACLALASGRTPTLAKYLADPGGKSNGGQWEKRHSPASFTYAAHHAFFAGFLPTPATPGKHPRRFAARFAGSETTTPDTLLFDTPDIVSGFASHGYHTACIGGVGFFNKATPLGSVLPSLFAESHWSPELGVTSPTSTARQVQLALEILHRTPSNLFLFINISAIHQPNCLFSPGAASDSLDTHIAALAYVDHHLATLFDALAKPTFVILCSDHGTAYGEDGFSGHRLAHPVVYTVPYAEFLLPRRSAP